MRNILESIARENFRSSGFVSRLKSDRRSEWEYLAPPRSPYTARNTIDTMIQRRERAQQRTQTKTSLLRYCFNALLHR